jgi:GNAT superfamily N-acetyltransferase
VGSQARAAEIELRTLTGPEIETALAEVARLRIAVFRDWPYVYDGTLDYERGYLAEFAKARDAVIVIAREDGKVIGAATAAPLEGHTTEFAPLFAARGLDPKRVFYCGESVLLPAYRGRGLGHAFFDRRETHARACTSDQGPYSHVSFCAVVRPDDDPRAPAGYRPLDGFWRRRGYQPVAGLVGHYSWKEIGASRETEKRMQFWMKEL